MNVLLFFAILLRVVAAWLTIRLFLRFKKWQTALFAVMATLIALRTYIWIDWPISWRLDFTYSTEYMLTVGTGVIVLVFALALFGLFSSFNSQLLDMTKERGEKQGAQDSLRDVNRLLEKSNNELELRIEERTRQLREEVEERKFSERALSESEERFRDIIDSTMDWVWESDADLQIIYMSERSALEPGKSLNNGVGQSLLGFLGTDIPNQSCLTFIDTALTNHSTFKNVELEMRSKAGDVIYMRASGKPIYNQANDFVGYRGTLADITDAREAYMLRDKLVAAFDALESGFSIWDPQDRFVTSNSKYIKLMNECAAFLHEGITYEEFVRAQAPAMKARGSNFNLEEWVAEKVAIHLDETISIEYSADDEIWIRVDKQKLADGSIIAFHTDISEMKIRENELEEARGIAEAANSSKSDFLSAMSHELRTPLNAILGFGQLLSVTGETSLTVEQKGNVDHIVAAGTHLLSLVNEILDLAKIESGSVEIDIDVVSVAEIMDISLEMTEAQFQDSGIGFLGGTELRDLPPVYADPIRLKQVFINLLSNAIKYNRSNGTVSLDYRELENDMLRISVTDTGYGISEEDQSELFKPFSRLGQEFSEIEGTGIGLVVTRQLVELMNGTIGFESTENEGSTFWVDLPIEHGDKTMPQLLDIAADAGEAIPLPAE
ncbi:MAG: PAS domain S-box protein [Rhodospirillaceae bacterium]|jgi:PAS domain S-box-containing protein|nr:PAS domain S-box protein [Rhodospirillaceae bacterium]MBT7265822.1 PAS domain S-box protein [Rhodospirillaceae bacterium]